MTQKAYIRVDMGADGKTPERQLVYDGEVVGDLSYIDLVELVMQATSTFRYEKDAPRLRKR